MGVKAVLVGGPLDGEEVNLHWADQYLEFPLTDLESAHYQQIGYWSSDKLRYDFVE